MGNWCLLLCSILVLGSNVCIGEILSVVDIISNWRLLCNVCLILMVNVKLKLLCRFCLWNLLNRMILMLLSFGFCWIWWFRIFLVIIFNWVFWLIVCLFFMWYFMVCFIDLFNCLVKKVVSCLIMICLGCSIIICCLFWVNNVNGIVVDLFVFGGVFNKILCVFSVLYSGVSKDFIGSVILEWFL